MRCLVACEVLLVGSGVATWLKSQPKKWLLQPIGFVTTTAARRLDNCCTTAVSRKCECVLKEHPSLLWNQLQGQSFFLFFEYDTLAWHILVNFYWSCFWWLLLGCWKGETMFFEFRTSWLSPRANVFLLELAQPICTFSIPNWDHVPIHSEIVSLFNMNGASKKEQHGTAQSVWQNN